MTLVTLDTELIGGVLGAIISVIVAAYGYLQAKGYITKWKTKLSISNDVAEEVKKQNHSALEKLRLSDDILHILQLHASDETGLIDPDKLIIVLDNYKRIHELVSLKRGMTMKEQDEVCSIVFKILGDHTELKENEPGQRPHTPKTG